MVLTQAVQWEIFLMRTGICQEILVLLHGHATTCPINVAPDADAETTPCTAGILHRYLALLWQIYSCCCSLQIHFRQCGHRRGGSRAMSSGMAWRTAGRVGWGGGPLIIIEKLIRESCAAQNLPK